MTNLEALAESIADLEEGERCPICGDDVLIPCPDHLVQVDEDGWCVTCDGHPDEKNPEITCPCQSLGSAE